MTPLAEALRAGELSWSWAEKPAAAGVRVAGALLAVFASVILALAYTFPPLTGRVVDEANVIPPAVASRITEKLADLESNSGIQLVVATVKSLEGDEIEPYANALFRAWGLGEKQKNNGVLLLVAPNEHKVRIEVGYGLEGTLTDALSKIIISNAIAPRFKAGDFGGGVERGVDDIITVLTTDSSEWQKRPDLRVVSKDSAFDDLGPWIALALFVLIFFLLTPPRERGNLLSFLLGMLMSSGRGGYGRRGRWDDEGWGGGGSGSGGFFGGGGSSGGGGASGSW
ncbi:MAG TPA: TPM domain-containing protein [Methylocella sp.]|nr:TPM domain-containing protein [Methylocella sp.]